MAFSGSDQYVPEHVDKFQLTNRMVDAMNGKFGNIDSKKTVAEALYIEKGDHNLSGPDEAKQFVDKFSELLATINNGSTKKE